MVLVDFLFLIAIALLSKEYWAKIKQWFSKVFRKVKPEEN
ncbi:hypothetical protein [Acinetobacter baumannii]|nr:hypothetical protein [Acinetobacter baumannii]